MYSLEKALDDHELIVLRVIGEWWELELTGEDKAACIKELSGALSRLDMSAEMDYLGPEEAAALEDLIQSGGKVPVATFERTHGKVRQMGPGRLEREEPWLEPASPTESLWYRGFLYRGFDEAEGADFAEFYYLPTELLEQFPPPTEKQSPKPKVIREPQPELLEETEPELPADFDDFLRKVKKGKQVNAAPKNEPVKAVPKREPIKSAPKNEPLKTARKAEPEPEPSVIQAVKGPKSFETAVTHAIDDMTTILALSQNYPLQKDAIDWLTAYLIDPNPARRDLLVTLAFEQGLLRETDMGDSPGYRPARPAVPWLRKEREGQLRDLIEGWSSSAWNDLCHVPELACEGSNWKNDPILARTAMLDVLPHSTDWFTTADLAAFIYETDPDFQRPDGNYKTWYIRDQLSGSYLSGFENWDQVEGRLITFLITGPLHWLGMTEYATYEEGTTIYRLTPRAVAWLNNSPPPTVKEVTAPIVVQDDATLLIPLTANRYHRFQATRITEPLPVEEGRPYQYTFTPQSLQQASEQGIEPDRLLQFLAEASGRALPASTKRAIERWAEKKTEARLEQVVILRVNEADILEKLQANPRTRPYLSEFLGDLTVIVRSGDWPKLRQAAAQLGLLLEAEFDD
jgi:hypothetical protein